MKTVQNKIALIIGINNYEYFPNLEKCENDSKDMHEFLQKLGFESKLLLNSSQRDLVHELKDFKIKANECDLSLIYFSGHGLQVDIPEHVDPLKQNKSRVQT